MPFKVSDEEKPKFNKRVQESFTLLSEQLEDVAFQGAASEEPAIELDSIRDADGNIISNSLDLFSTPLNGDKSKALGLVDADGNATDKGELFFNMKEAGMFDDTGVITDKGKAYLLPEEELKKKENLQAFSQLWDDGVIREEVGFDDMLGAVKKLVGEAATGGGEALVRESKNFFYNVIHPNARIGKENRPQELIDETIAGNLAYVESLTRNTLELAKMADVGSALLMNNISVADPRLATIGYSSPIPATDQEDRLKAGDELLREAQQRQWSMRKNIANYGVGKIAESIVGIEGAMADAEIAKKNMGEAEFNRVYKNATSFMDIVGGPENFIPGAFALKISKLPALTTRLNLVAQRNIGRVLLQDLEIAAKQTSIEAAKATVEKGTVANTLASRIAQKGSEVGADPATIARAEKAAEIASRTARTTDEATAVIPRLTSELDELLKQRNSLATRIPEVAAQATIKTLEAGRALRGLPVTALGGVVERFGNTLTKVDTALTNFLKERGIDQMYTAGVGAAGVAGVAGNPIIGSIAAGAAALKTGKAISNYGKLFRYVGEEMTFAKGQIPFWKRVAAHTEPGSLNRGIAHTFNMLDLGGVTSDTLRKIPQGITAAYPVDLMFEYLSDGGDMRPQTFYQAAAESLVIGGSFAAAGGAFMGTKNRMRELSNGDRLNFMQNMEDPRQKVLYGELSPGNQKAIATYSIANPTLNYVFKDNGASNYDPNTNTATINVRSNNSIKPLIAHETLHHTIIKNNMEAGISALFLGDTVNNTVGGLLRSKDGKLDPNFKAFTDAYYQRLRAGGMTDAEINATYPLDKIAVEYFIEQHSDQYASMAESGELGAIAASGDFKRKLSGVLETVLPRIPVLRDLHFKSGGMIDKDGGWVTGNGILDAGGVKTNPITNKMFRDMNRRSSGLAPGQFEPLVSDKQDSGAQLSLDPSNPIDSELLHPLVKVDENGSPVLVDGKPVALDKVTLLQRALAGLTAKEVMSRKKAENYIPEKGEAHVDDAGEFQPGWLSNDILAEMFAKNSFNPEQKRIIREMNRMIRKGDGGRAVMINFPATTRNKAGKVVYKAQGATLRDTVPVAITISKEGNLLFGLMSVNKLQENIQKRSRSRLGKKLYGGNVDLILRDTQAMMQFHKDGVDSIEYFKEKYGAVEATGRKNFINTMFGLLNQKEQAVLNPMLIEDGVKSRDNVYRTYRADRVSKAVAMSPDDYPAMPFSYEAVSQVKMPEQSRQMLEEPITSSSERWKSMSNKEKDAYVFAPVEMTPSNRAEFDARVKSGSLSADTPVVDINRSNLLTSKYGPPSSSATGNINTWIDDNTGKPVAVAFSENGNIPTKGERNQTPRYMPEKVDADYMKAVEDGDVEMQQRAVDEAARAAGYKFQAKHGTPEKKLFTKFGERGKLTGAKSAEKAFFFSDSEALTDTYRMQNRKEPDETLINDWVDGLSDTQISKLLPRDYRLPMDTPFMIEYARDTIKEQGLDFMNEMGEDIYYGLDELVSKAKSNKIPFPKEFDPKDIGNTYNVKLRIDDPYYFTYDQYEVSGMDGIVKQAIEKGHDGIISKDKISDAFSGWDNKTPPSGIIYAVFDPEQIKSTDPITRDDSGNIIPPSKRFNTESKDIRYMPEKINTKKENNLMDDALSSPRKIPNDLMEAWEIGRKTAHLSGTDAIYNGKVPEWIFNFGNDTIEFYEAGRRGEEPEYIVGWRYGDIPERGRSTNWAENKAESGVSLAYAHKRSDVELNPITISGVSGRKKTFVSGWAFPKSKWGSDGEIVILNAQNLNTDSKDIRYMPEKDADVKIIEKSDTDTEQGTPAPDSDVQSIPLTGNPIPWDRIASRQVRFMPEAIRDAFPTMSPELLAEIEKETSTLAAIHIDRMRVGEYMGIDLQGGMFYPTIKENLENGIVWAFNSTGVARTVANRAAQNNGYVKLVLMQEGNVVGNKTFANIWFKILSDGIEKKQISKGLALTELNAARRTVYKTLENKDIKKNPWVVKHAKKWNSIEEAKQAILSMPQIERGGTYFKKSKTQTKAEGEKIAYQALLSQKMAKLGFPDARKIVNDIEEPAFKGIPTGAAVAIIKFDLLGANDKVMTAKEAGVPEHMSYGYVLKGKPIAKLAYYQVVEETFPTTKGQIMTQQHTDFPVGKSIPSKEKARGEIKYNQATQLAIAKAAKLK